MIQYTENAVEEIEVKRTLKERLISLPWRPWKRTKVVYKPAILNAGVIYLVHPIFKTEIEKILDKYEPSWTELTERLKEMFPQELYECMQIDQGVYQHTFSVYRSGFNHDTALENILSPKDVC